jgi:hypothetical protein
MICANTVDIESKNCLISANNLYYLRLDRIHIIKFLHICVKGKQNCNYALKAYRGLLNHALLNPQVVCILY